MDIHRLLVTGTGRVFVQRTPGADVNTQFGMIRAAAIDAATDGDVVTGETGERLVVLTPSFIDRYTRIRRGPQIITRKDAGVIIATIGLGPESVVAEAGSGSGALTILLARQCGHVYSYDVSEENLAVAQENVASFGIANVTFRHHDVATGIPDTDVDALILDLPEPWDVFPHIAGAVTIGGHVVTYVPSTVQLHKLRRAADEAGLLHLRSIEVIERPWQARGDAVRPTSKGLGFTAFLSFFRWIGPHWAALRPPQRRPSDGPALPSAEGMQRLFR